ncbi:MAG: tetratricopeptide repeat protein [Thermoguttaceae bacterium]|nr:tetratricopeptide repeat protein [Thermoguttaceae bacterium]
MEDERKHLAEKIFPRIRKECKKRGVEFVPIDLRWGITKEQANNGKTLEICLREIDSSRPFFICLLGDRYGSTISSLPGKPDAAFLNNYPKVKNYINENIGVTEAEIRHGVLDLGDKVEACFWIRSSANPEPRLLELEDRIRKDGRRFPVEEYETITDLGDKVEKALEGWINKNWSNPEELPWFEKQNLEQRTFERSRRRLYVSNSNDFRKLDNFTEDSESNVLGVIGKPGLGKSSLLVNWADHYREAHPEALVLTHYVSASEGSDSLANLLCRLKRESDPTETTREIDGLLYILEKKNFQKDYETDEERQSKNELKGLFCAAVKERLAENSYKSRLVLVVDGLNQLSNSGNSRELYWLPDTLDNVKVIVSTVDSDTTTCNAITSRFYAKFQLLPLARDQRLTIIEKVLKDRGRSLDVDPSEKIASSPLFSNPLALCVLLDELCCLGDFRQLNSAIDRYRNSHSIEEFLQKVLERIEKSLNWLNKDSGKEIVSTLASMIAVSRYGLTGVELQKASPYEPLVVSTFLAVFDELLVNHAGRYSYSHDYIKSTIERRYVTRFVEARELLVRYFNNQDDFSRLLQEVPYQLCEMREWERLHEFLLGSDESCHYMMGDEFESYWIKLNLSEYWKYRFAKYYSLAASCNDVEEKAALWLKIGNIGRNRSLLWNLDQFRACGEALYLYYKLARKNPDVYRSKCFHLSDELFKKWGKLYRNNEKYYHFSEEVDNVLALKNPEQYDYYVAVLLDRLGSINFELDFFFVAESYYQTSLEISRELAQENSDVYSFLVATVLNNLGLLHKKTGQYALAMSEYQESLGIYRSLCLKEPDVYKSFVATSLNYLANLHFEQKEYSQAESEYEESLSIRRLLAKEKRLSDNSYVYNLRMAETLNDLANLHSETGAYSSAKSEYEEALKIRENEAYDRWNKLCAADALNNLGALLDAMGEGSSAEEKYEESLAIRYEIAADDRSRQWWPENLDVYNSGFASTLNNLAVLHERAGSCSDLGSDKQLRFYSVAEQEYLDCLSIYRELAIKSSAAYDYYVAATLNNLGLLHCETRCESAEAEFEESLSMFRELAKKNPDVYNPYVVQILNNLGNLCETKGDYSNAESAYSESLDICRKLAAKNSDVYNPFVANTLNNIGALHHETGSYVVAESEYQESLAIYKEEAKTKPNDYNFCVADLFNNLGVLHYETGSYSLAESEYKESLRIYFDLATENDSYNADVADVLNSLGSLCCKTGAYEAAKSYYKKALKIRRELAKGTPDVFNCEVSQTLNCLTNLRRQTCLIINIWKTIRQWFINRPTDRNKM